MAQPETDEDLLKRAAEMERLIRSNIDLIPVDNWGFDEEVREKVKNRKHEIVNTNLTKDSKRKMSNAAKQLAAAELGGTFRTVSEVIDWLGEIGTDTKPTKKRVKAESAEMVTQPSVSTASRSEEKESESSKSPSKKRKKIDSGQETDVGNAMEVEGVTSDSKEEVRAKISNVESEAAGDNPDLKTFPKKKQKNRGQKKAEAKRKRVESMDMDDTEAPKKEKSKPRPLDFANVTDRTLAMQRLQAKLEQMKMVRRGKKTAEQYEEARKMKRRLSKMKMKERRRVEKQQSGSGNREKESTGDGPPAKKAKLEVKGVVNGTGADAGKIVYSKFDFIVKDEKKKLTKKDKRDKFSGKDYKRLLEKAEKRKERIEDIREKNPEKAERIEENILWNKALSRAEGEKVKDNPELLKKGLKKKEKTKERKKRKWDERMKNVKHRQEQQQEKRQSNIQARKDAKNKRKLEKARKKGRVL